MGLTTKTRKILALLLSVAALSSCVKEYPVNGSATENDGTAKVTLAVRVPGSNAPTTRALDQTQEDEVTEIMVLAFARGGGDTELQHVGISSGAPTSPDEDNTRIKRFTVDLYEGIWDLMVIANPAKVFAQSGLDVKYKNLYDSKAVASGITKSDLQTVLTLTESGKWNVDADDSGKGYLMPMWGMKNEVTVETSSTAIVQTVNLYRMISKIGVRVQRTPDEDQPTLYPGMDESKFELTYVSLHNYSTTGRLVPGLAAEDGLWTQDGGGVALKTSLPANTNSVYGHLTTQRLEWGVSDLTVAKTALEGMIYTFEADKGSSSGDRPCLIIGGKYNGSNDVTYYRADFVDDGKQYLDILRNHSYQMLIRKITGKGFATVEEAYTAGPTNIDAETIPWNESGYLEGVWNGSNYIKFSTLTAHLSQFGEPAATITIKTNSPELTLDSFQPVEEVEGDASWSGTDGATGTWTNGRFTVVSALTATNDDERVYTLTITAIPTDEGDTRRTSTFRIKALNLEVTATISQDSHIGFLLKSDDQTTLREIDEKEQRVEINLYSTHPYMVDFDSDPMFLGVYTVASGGSPIDQTNIPPTINKLFIEVAEQTSEEIRMGDIFIEHIASVNSTAGALTYKVLQVTPIIDAVLSTGGREETIRRAGGSVTINVTSNLSGWVPVLTLKDDTLGDQPITSNLETYFSPASGALNKSVIFRLPALTGDTDQVYEIRFQDVNDQMTTINPIEITQQSFGAIPPTKGVPATEGILAVNNKGELNIDGQTKIGTDGITSNYIVYFKWGSTIAIHGGDAGDVFDSANHIAWAPTEFDITRITDWATVPYANSTIHNGAYITAFPSDNTPEQLAAGLGDPCKFMNKDGKSWRMPTGNPYENFVYSSEITGGNPKWLPANNSYSSMNGMYDDVNKQFYPAAGHRQPTGMFSNTVAIQGLYWSTTYYNSYASQYGRFVFFDKDSVKPATGTSFYDRYAGLSVRCIAE